MATMTRREYATLYGPTTGDAVRLGDTSLLAEIEHDILDFCDAHPDETFCGKLGAYLRSHPQPRSR